MRACCICQANTEADGNLVDGSVFHRSCYNQLKETTERLSRIEHNLLVEMGKPRSEEASNDQARFWLCVVPLDSDEDIDELTPERVEDLARFVSGIGSRLAPAREDIQDAVESADESGFDLEHVDDIRYGIRSEIWEGEAMPLKGFVDLLGKQLAAMRR